MNDNLQDFSPAELEKLGSAAGKLVLARALMEVIYGVRINLPSEQVGQRVAKFLKVLDDYIDWRISGAMKDVLAEVLAELQKTSGDHGSA